MIVHFPSFFQITPTWHVSWQLFFKHYRCSVFRQDKKLLKRFQRHVFAFRHDNYLVVTPGQLDVSIQNFCRLQLPVGDVVESVAAVPQFMCGFANRLFLKPIRLADGHRLQPARWVAPKIRDWPIQQNVMVRFAGLQNRLAPRDVFIERREIVPDGVARVHFRRGVKQPARPRRVLRRIAGTVVVDVVHPGQEHFIGE